MSQIIMILLISLLVLVHEAGHFIAARMCGIRVTRFGIGMPIGPSWKIFTWGKTDFYIHAFLFGGYVSFPDDEPENQGASDSEANGSRAEVCEARDGNALSIGEQSGNLTNATCAESTQEQPENQGASDSEAEGNRCVEHADGSDELATSAQPYQKASESSDKEEEIPENELYENKTIAQKLFVVSAGVIMNIVFAFILVFLCASIYHKLPTSTQNLYVNGFASKATSNIEQMGIKKGDKVEKVNSIEVKSLYQLSFFAKNSKLFDDYAQVDLIEKNLEQLKKMNPQVKDTFKKDDVIILPKTYTETPLKVNEDVLKGFERYKKDGIKLNESQIELRNLVYGKKTFKALSEISLNDLALALSDTYKPVEITVVRDNEEVLIKNIEVSSDGAFGVMLKVEEIYTETKTLKDIIIKSYDYIYTTTATMLKGLWQLFTGKVSASDMHGVIAVVKIGGDIILVDIVPDKARRNRSRKGILK